MMISKSVFWPIMLPGSIILIGLLAGYIFEKIIFNRLRKFSTRTQWEGDDILIEGMRGIVTFWFILGSLFIALLNIQLPKDLILLIQKVLMVLIILSITIFIAKITVGFVNLYAKKREEILPSSTIISNLTRLIIFIIGILVILQSLGISITPVLTALGVGGLAVALALQDTLSNFFSGIYLILSRQLKPGDYVKLDSGEEGYIADVTWRNTTIKVLANNMIVVPNSKLAAAIITNFYQPGKEMGLVIPVGVGYDSDLERVEKITLEVAKEIMQQTPGSVSDFEPLIRFHTFAESSIDMSVILRVHEFGDQYLLKHQFIKRLHQRYREEGIEIPFPIRTVHLKSEINHNSDLLQK